MTTRNLAAPRVHTGNRVLDDLVRVVLQLVQRLNAFALLGGVLIDAEPGKPSRTGLSFTSGTAQSIAHGLGRKAVGFFEVSGVDLPSAAHVGLRASAMPAGITSLTHVTVTPASTGTAFLYVF